MKRLTILAASAAVLLATPAAAQTDADVQRDLHCMALFLAVANSDDPQMIQGGTVGAMFFYGRLQGRDPQAPWLDRLGALSDSITLDELNARGAECGGEMQRVGQEMVAYAERYEPAQSGD